MNEFLLAARGKSIPVDTGDPNSDSAIATLVATYPANQLKAFSATLPNTTGALAMGYWNGYLYVINGTQAYMFNPLSSMARVGTLTLTMTVPTGLNGTQYQDGKYLYVGWSRGNSTGDIYQVDLSTGTVVKLPNSGLTRGVMFVYKGKLYLSAAWSGATLMKTSLQALDLSKSADPNWAWDVVALNGSLTMALNGGNAQFVGNRVYFVGGGQSTSYNSSSDGNSYSSVDYIDMDTLVPGNLVFKSGNITSNYHQPCVVWDGYIWYLPYSTTQFRRWSLVDGSYSTFNSTTATGNYHDIFVRIGAILFVAFYSQQGISLISLKGT